MDLGGSNSSLVECYDWLKDFLKGDNISLVDINDAIVTRNKFGIWFISILLVIGFIGNAHVILVHWCHYKTSNYSTNVLFLACLDIVNCCINMPLVIFNLYHPLTFPSESFCKIFRFVLFYVNVSSEIILVAIATDRHRKICQPLKPQFSQNKTKTFCSLSLLIGMLFTWPTTIIYGDCSIVTGVGNITGIRCFTANNIWGTNFQTIFNAVLIFLFLVVVTVLITMYARIISKLKGQITKRSAIFSLDSNRSYSVKRLKTGNANMTFLAVTSVFMISALPHHILAILYFLVDKFECRLSYTESSVYYTLIWIFFVNSCANPFVYGFSDSKFRLILKQIYCCRGNTNSNQNTSINDKVICSDEMKTN